MKENHSQCVRQKFVFAQVTKIQTITLLYNTLVRPQLEYLTPIWTPYQITYTSKLEKVQQKYTRQLFYKLRTPYTDHNNRLIHVRVLSLEARREYFDMCLLYDIVHNNSLSVLSNKFTYRDTHQPNRQNCLFCPGQGRTNYGLYCDNVNRLQRHFNIKFNHMDILNMSSPVFWQSKLQKL